MKRLFVLVLSFLMIIPGSVALAADGYTPPVDEITKEEAYQFADELNEMRSKNYDVSNRLIVSSNKDIDYIDAVDVATGIDGLYVPQFSDSECTSEAYDYYNSLSYVNYVEYDKQEQKKAICSVEDSNYTLQCFSSANCYIDDAIKLANEISNGDMPEIRVGIMDTGIKSAGYDRVIGGYNFSSDNPEAYYDHNGHGSKVMGVVLLNTPDTVKIMGYKVLTDEAYVLEDYSVYVSALYMAVADGCRVINYSMIVGSKAIEEAINYATDMGCIVVAGAGNDSRNSASPPAKYENVIGVGALNDGNKIASFSNYGDGVDVFAPGVAIKYETENNGITSSFSGTSAASPMVAAICAIMLSANPDYTPKQIKEAIVNTGYSTNEENINGKDRTVANAYEALKYISGKELPQVNLEYELNYNPQTGFCDISFIADKGASVFYTTGSGGDLYIPYYDQGNIMEQYKSCFKYEIGTTVSLKKYCTITVCAYAPGKAKSNVEYIMAPSYTDESGYRITPNTSAITNNILDNCRLIDEKVLEIPQYINDVEVQEIGKYCFMGNQTVEKIILPASVKQIDKYVFANCPNLKEVIAPGVEECGIYAFSNCENLVNVEMPNVTVANTGMFKNCTSLETAKLGTLTEIDNHAFYGCENLKLVKTTSDDISFAVNTFKDCDSLTVYTPEGSSMEVFAKENKIPLLGTVTKNGGSIRVTDAGLRFGYQYNGEENKNIEEYGFVYNSGKTDNLTIDNALKLVANNRIDHGDYTTYNLVFTDVPKEAYNQVVSAKAYIKFAGEYFYSDTVQHSFKSVADAVLADDEIDKATKDKITQLLAS